MSADAAHLLDSLDIDPGWYPGQLEVTDEAGSAGDEAAQQEQQQLAATPNNSGAWAEEAQAEDGTGARPGSSSGGGGGGGAGVRVPTVLTKLQKWGDYATVGNAVQPTKFVPMKTPLSGEILANWSLPRAPRHRLTVPEMLAQQAALGRKVGLLLDLSNHDCLYAADIPPSLAYTHIQLVAKELPPQDFVDAVVAAANRFWEAHPDEYIAVHCAYGFNRTGFVVCCYLIECCGLGVEEALAAFAVARPPGVKHELFRAELHRRYGDGRAAALRPSLGASAAGALLAGYLDGHGCSSSNAGVVVVGSGAGGSPGGGDSLGGSLGGGAAAGALYGAANLYGYALQHGSPEANSSFGCSPSCRSIDLRDMVVGPSPLSRGATGLLEAAAPGGHCGVGDVGGGGVLGLHHNTLTVSYTTAAGGGGGGGGGGGAAHAAEAAHAHQAAAAAAAVTKAYVAAHAHALQHALTAHQQQGAGGAAAAAAQQQQVAGQHGQAGAAGGGPPWHAAARPPPPAHGGDAGDAALWRRVREQQQQQQQHEQGAAASGFQAAAAERRPSSERSPGNPSSAERLPLCMHRNSSIGCSGELPGMGENESLGVTDRYILAAFRQHAAVLSAQAQAPIPEEGCGSSGSSPARSGGASGSVHGGGAAEGGGEGASGGGASVPQPKRPFAHKSLDSIDWGLAAAEDGGGAGTGVGVGAEASAWEGKGGSAQQQRQQQQVVDGLSAFRLAQG